MNTQYHILNGDALLERFPKSIPGERIVARECLVDGDVDGAYPDPFFSNRAVFLSRTYGEPEQSYFDNVVPEFQKMESINSGSEINLWFEDDLFCQVNFWFVAHLLQKSGIQGDKVFLVRPKSHSRYSFAGLSYEELSDILINRIPLNNLAQVAELWKSYQKNDLDSLLNTATNLGEKYPFILPVVNAHVERIPAHNNPGRIVHSLIQIMEDLDTKNFGPVFREFCKREAIYGLGDLQVKRYFDELLKKDE